MPVKLLRCFDHLRCQKKTVFHSSTATAADIQILATTAESRKQDLCKMMSLSATMHRQELIVAARNTFCYRHTDIQRTQPTFAACVTAVPCYKSIPEIILHDFQLLHPSGFDAFVGKFDSELVPRVLEIAKASKNPFLVSIAQAARISRDNMGIDAMKVLLHLLPTTGKKRISAAEAFSGIVETNLPGVPVDAQRLSKLHPVIIRQLADDGTAL